MTLIPLYGHEALRARLAEALDNQIEWGVWGGMTERERRALLRRRPGSSWRTILETARTKVETPSVSV